MMENYLFLKLSRDMEILFRANLYPVAQYIESRKLIDIAYPKPMYTISDENSLSYGLKVSTIPKFSSSRIMHSEFLHKDPGQN